MHYRRLASPRGRSSRAIAALAWLSSLTALGLVKARVALAEPAPAPAESAPAPPAAPWSFAVGLAYVGAIGGLGGMPLPVTGFVTLERRLAGPLSLMGRVAASFGSTTASADSVVVDATSTGASVMDALGLKVSFGSRDTLEVSPFALLDGAYGWAGGAAAHAHSSSIGGALGLALDRDIVTNFGIRLSAVLATVEHDEMVIAYKDHPSDTEHRTESSSLSVALKFYPAAELRWSF
ncbi:MAG: hypothetical protein U0414_39245 [Polyangiaceae bacterium]